MICLSYTFHYLAPGNKYFASLLICYFTFHKKMPLDVAYSLRPSTMLNFRTQKWLLRLTLASHTCSNHHVVST